MYSEEERKLAGKILEQPELMALLKKIYCPNRSTMRSEIEAVISLPDDVYGQQMKALVMAEKHFVDAHANIKRIALKEKLEGSFTNGVAPK